MKKMLVWCILGCMLFSMGCGAEEAAAPKTEQAETEKEEAPESVVEPEEVPEEETLVMPFSCTAIPENEEIPIAAPLSSQFENIFCLETAYGEESGMNEVSVRLNDRTLEVGLFGGAVKAYLLNDGMYSFVLLDADYMSADHVTVVYDVSTGAIRETDRLEGTSIVEESLGEEQFELNTRLDVLGTYGGTKTYRIDGKSGKLQTDDNAYRIDVSDVDAYVLITVKELPVVMEGTEEMLPVGSKIRVTGTDDEGIVWFENVETGETGEIQYVRGDGAEDRWTIHIDGIPEQEYFDGYLPYAG